MNIETERDAIYFITILRNKGEFDKCIEYKDILQDMYPWSVPILTEIGTALACVHRYTDAIDIYMNLLNRALTKEQCSILVYNLKFMLKSQYGKYTHYEHVMPVPRYPSIHTIAFTITTCKRYDLFERTMNSFLKCCKDLWRIGSWFCVDDNSSEEDRAKMREKYPFFEFYMKTPEEKGHAQSMNIIRTYARNQNIPYIFHMEDDWEFIVQDEFIGKCLKVVGSNPCIKQCITNQHYALNTDQFDIIGGENATTDDGMKYLIHEHISNKEYCIKYSLGDDNKARLERIVAQLRVCNDQAIINSLKEAGIDNKSITFEELVHYAQEGREDGIMYKYIMHRNCAYWPHFSLHPGLISADIFTILDEFPTIGHFERDYGYMYTRRGFKTAFLYGLVCIHTGTQPENAYKLNSVKQFIV